MFRWRRIQGLHFLGENGYQNTCGETRAATGQAPGDTIFLSIHQILTLSLLSWGEYWLAVLQSPHSAFSSFCSCFLRKSSHHWTQTLLLKLSLSCLDEDFDDEPLEGVDFFSIFTLTFFFFLDLSLSEDSPRPPSYSFMAFSYSLLASSALRSHSFFSLDIPFQVSPAFLERSVMLIPDGPP